MSVQAYHIVVIRVHSEHIRFEEVAQGVGWLHIVPRVGSTKAQGDDMVQCSRHLRWQSQLWVNVLTAQLANPVVVPVDHIGVYLVAVLIGLAPTLVLSSVGALPLSPGRGLL